ncbi:hypothetical protein AQJ43_25780 [Streptomyces avermitilis]|uniref:Secreted protein n=1 Tax=Streptomyces avermitilis TaxID=33903 RepID=A0A4D4MSN1_STRAX|nr:hypothetical protein [Streptomyces avermitilis]MYT00843.1 hypothetical protein [Streptomyces sp. SID5469]KUN51832.1 hypothetical protein AQJ43_25780 [Streptomyces avermitilis]BBJ53379.1 hypothetical protein SAVMC3_60080 [Streptomyces avermitilis]GDY65395.1 hypothetical protein SAV14893_047880 [Streptomyces avermitilis]GDY74399.1 hypothetical protein SAV31267_038840 [Streptomyces avermitilis]
MLRSARGRVVTTVLAATALLLGAQGTATAAAQRANTEGGYALWNADPDGATPGDSVRACDTTTDGWGIEARLDINRDGTIDRTASTRGRTAPYCTAWKSGDIPEGAPVAVYAVTVRGDDTKDKGGLIWSHA